MLDDRGCVQEISVKTEPKDGSDTDVCDDKEYLDLPVKFEVGDSEAAGRGVDGGLRGRPGEEEVTSTGIYGTFVCFLFHLRVYSIS